MIDVSVAPLDNGCIITIVKTTLEGVKRTNYNKAGYSGVVSTTIALSQSSGKRRPASSYFTIAFQHLQARWRYSPLGFFVAQRSERERDMATARFKELVDIAPIKGQPTIQFATVSDLLRDFRKNIEREAGQGCQEIEAPVAMVLFDLCQYLRLNDALQLKVLGASADRWIRCQLGDKPRLPKIH